MISTRTLSIEHLTVAVDVAIKQFRSKEDLSDGFSSPESAWSSEVEIMENIMTHEKSQIAPILGGFFNNGRILHHRALGHWGGLLESTY